MRYPDLGEHPAAPGLRTQWSQPWIGGVHRNAEADRDVTLELGGVVGNQVRTHRIGDEVGEPLEQPRPSQQLLAERDRRGVVHRDQRQPGPRMTRDHAGQQRQVVLDDLGRDRYRGHVDHPQPRLPQQDQQEQEPFLVGLHHRPGPGRLGPIQRQRRYDDHRLVVVVEPHRLPHPGHPRLQLVEVLVPLVLGQCGQATSRLTRSGPQVAGHDATLELSRPRMLYACTVRLKPRTSRSPASSPMTALPAAL